MNDAPSAVPMRWVLASASPARLGVLRAAGIEPDVIVSHVDESNEAGCAGDIALNLAMRKAETVATGLGSVTNLTAVVGCDSVLEFEGKTWGKPRDPAEAIARWTQMRGQYGTLHTGHCLVAIQQDLATKTASRLASTRIHFADAHEDEIAAYVATGEPLHVAGGFTIDGLGGWLVQSIQGDHNNVIGLSLPTLRELLHDLNLEVPFVHSH